MVHLEVLQFDPKFLACKMVLNNCSSYILKIHFRRKFLNAALNRFGVVLVVYMCLYIKVMHVHFECRRFIHLHKYILVICFKRAYIHLLCVHVEWVSVCGWKTYDMWQLVGRCHRGGRKQRGELLLPWRPHRVAHGRVAWSRNQLRERELNNRTRERRKNIFFLYIFIVQNSGQKHLTVWQSPAAGIYIKPTSSQHKSRVKLETCLGINVTDPALGAATHVFIQDLISLSSLWVFHRSCFPHAPNLSLHCYQK